MSSLLPISLSSSSSTAISGSSIKRSRVLEASSSLSSSSSLNHSTHQNSHNLQRLPIVLIREIFDFLLIDESALSQTACRHIRAVLLSKAASHFVLAGGRKKCDVEVVKRYISEKNFHFIRKIDLAHVRLPSIREVFTHPMPRLTGLRLCISSTDSITDILTSHCPELTFLDFNGDARQDLNQMHLPKLKKLDLARMSENSTEEIVSLGLKSPLLEWLSLANKRLEHVTNSLSVLVFKDLKFLDLDFYGFITDNNLRALAVNNPELQELHLDYCEFRSQDRLNESEFIFPRLKFLSMHTYENTHPEDQFDLSKFHCKELEELVFGGGNNLSGLIGFVKKSPLLRSLDLTECPNIEHLPILSHLKHLNCLKLSFSEESDDFFQEALEIIGRSCSQLRVLDFSVYYIDDWEDDLGSSEEQTRLCMTSKLVQGLNFLELTDLRLPICGFQEEALEEISRKFSKLERLEISLRKVYWIKEDEEGEIEDENAPRLTVDSLRLLRLPNLKFLLVHGELFDQIEPELCGILKTNCPQLESVEGIKGFNISRE